MKKFILTIIFLFVLTTIYASENRIYDTGESKHELNLLRTEPVPNIELFNKRGEYLILSSNYQLMSYGCILVSGLLFYGYSNELLYGEHIPVISGMLILTSVGLQITSWVYVNKAGKIIIPLNKTNWSLKR